SDYIGRLHQSIPVELQSRVKFLGEITQNEIVEWYHSASVFAFPSVWDEPFGIPVIEAMASGVPVVATRSGAVPEIIEHGKTGLLVEQGSSDQLAESLSRVLGDVSLSTSLGSSGAAAVQERFSWNKIAARLQGIYEQA
ncbi:MAG: glycosyltransferase family 4 protein, partial [bacterium]